MISPMFRCFVFCLFGVLLVAAVGCRLNRSFSPIALAPSSERSRLGIAAMERGDFVEAEKRLEDAVRLNKNDINHRRYYAEALWQQGKHQEALQQLDEAVKRGGQNSDSLHISLAEKYLAIREYTTAYRYADEAVRLNPQDARCWALRGRAKRLQAIHQAGYAEHSVAMFHQARADYLRAVSLSPHDRELLAELAAVQMSCGQPEQALATWLTVQNLYPQGGEPAEVLIGKTETLLVLRRFDEVEMNLTAIRQRGLENSEAGRRLQEIMMAAQGGIRR
jgi:tetratricopeptide (TPR) repeat protein